MPSGHKYSILDYTIHIQLFSFILTNQLHSLNYFLKRENISLNSTRKPDYALLLSVFPCFTICFPFRLCPPFTIKTSSLCHNDYICYPYVYSRVESQRKLLNHAHTVFHLFVLVYVEMKMLCFDLHINKHIIDGIHRNMLLNYNRTEQRIRFVSFSGETAMAAAFQSPTRNIGWYREFQVWGYFRFPRLHKCVRM